ncbi:MAG: acylglycerol kinase family protein, partial [Candidatus Marinimicrobia bacterium]|nr:acylglycerol kinase family protein [Candidatus Neomarinimicrobiota bacterium]
MENNPNELFVICNPLACGGKAADRWQTFLERAASFGLRVDARVTNFSGHATEIARTEARNGRHIIYVFGGDGTLNEVLNGVMENDRLISPEIELIYLTAGSS